MSKFKPVKYEANKCRLEVFGVLFEADTHQEAIRRYQNGEITFWQSWRGSFWGVLHDGNNNVTVLFNDHIGSKLVFYARTEKGLEWDTNPFALAQKIGAQVENENFLWQMLLYGYSPTGETVFKQIHRLQAGEYIYATGKKIEKRVYHRFDNTPNNLSIEENIERIDSVFRRAVERAIRKNEEYGYTHFLPLSAGLDSRLTCRVAQEIAKTPILYITYSQTGFYDETTPKELAAYWHNDIHFTSLDGGNCLLQLDEVSHITSGLIHYSGAAEALWGLPQEAKDKGGVFLTGMVGDIVVNTAFTENNQRQSYHIGEGALIQGNTDILKHVLPIDFEQLYSNRELYYLYVRGFNCANLGSPLIHQAYGESYSPFCDVDVLETAYSIPVEQRWNYRLYDQWILSKYPDLARWKHNGIYTIGHRPKIVSFLGRAIPLRELPKRIVWSALKRLHLYDFYKEKIGSSMNPEDDWFAQNETLYKWSEEYIQTYLSLLDKYPKVQHMAEKFSYGNAIERMQVLSLLACLRQAC